MQENVTPSLIFGEIACNQIKGIFFFFLCMESPLYLFERQPNSRNVLKVVCKAREFVGPRTVSQSDFNGWCDQEGMPNVMVSFPGLFVGLKGNLLRCKQIGSKKQCMKAVALLRSHVGKQEGILSSELLAWFLNTPVALAKKKLARDLSHPFHPVCFLVVLWKTDSI